MHVRSHTALLAAIGIFSVACASTSTEGVPGAPGARIGSANDSGPAASSGLGGRSSGSSSGLGSDSGAGPGSGSSGGNDAGASGEGGETGAAPVQPFGCRFAWGEPSPSGSSSSFSFLQFVTTWVGSEIQADGSLGSCSACSWLTGQVAQTSWVPVYYAYLIGFYGHANGLPDQNQNPNGANLATGGGALILANWNKIVQAYANYAQQSNKVWGSRPLVWLLEGDFVQYSASSQSKPLTYTQLGLLAADITSAIKSNMPNAVVAIDQSAWNSDSVTNSFWPAMAQANYDMVWTTAVGNNNGFLNSGANAQTYNGATATYSYLHRLTGKKILVDESAGMSQQSDTWSNQTAATIAARIAEGVIAVNVSGAPPNYASNVAALEPQLSSTCP
jgi:hypothetical protein